MVISVLNGSELSVIPHHGVDDNRHYRREDEKRHGHLRKERETGKNISRVEISFLQPEIKSKCEEGHQNRGGVRHEVCNVETRV